MSGGQISVSILAGLMVVVGAYLALTPTALLMRGAPEGFRPHPLDRRLPGWRRAMGVVVVIAGAALGWAIFAGKIAL